MYVRGRNIDNTQLRGKVLLKSDELTTAPIVGVFYVVPTYVRHRVDLSNLNMIRTIEVAPLINHLHSDKDNGQSDSHYHVDYRFMPCTDDFIWNLLPFSRIYPSQIKDFSIQYMKMKCVTSEYLAPTPVNLISNSKLKHRCIHKGKCPHRGYNLSTVNPVNGIITCPLHSLRFDAETKQLME